MNIVKRKDLEEQPRGVCNLKEIGDTNLSSFNMFESVRLETRTVMTILHCECVNFGISSLVEQSTTKPSNREVHCGQWCRFTWRSALTLTEWAKYFTTHRDMQLKESWRWHMRRLSVSKSWTSLSTSCWWTILQQACPWGRCVKNWNTLTLGSQESTLSWP